MELFSPRSGRAISPYGTFVLLPSAKITSIVSIVESPEGVPSALAFAVPKIS
jgi:hypothetical protein